MDRQRLVVVGGSAGAISVVQRLGAALPGDFPADILVCIHLSPSYPSELAPALAQSSRMPVEFARNGQPLTGGKIILAPPDRHLLVHDHMLRLTRGPKVNLARPAIDPLFRTAAAAWGARVIGVLLSGRLDDGSAGLVAVKRVGGIVVVQDPRGAEYAEMPQNALDFVDVDHVVTTDQLADLLSRLVNTAPSPSEPIPTELATESRMDLDANGSVAAEDQLGERSPLTCPECGGVLWMIDNGRLVHYRCHTGHAFSLEAMDVAQESALEAALWSAVRIHRERIELARRLVAKAFNQGHQQVAETWQRRAEEHARDADVILSLLLRSGRKPVVGT